MDPALASVAFIGVAGSITTLAGVVVESCKAIHKVWQSLKDAPRDDEPVFKKSKRLESVILEAKRAGEAFNGDTIRLDFRQEWLESTEEMSDDLLVLKAKILRVEGNLHGKFFSRKLLSVQIRKVFSEEDIAKYERILSRHLETFNMMLALIFQQGNWCKNLICNKRVLTRHAVN